MSNLFSGAKDILFGNEQKIAKPISNFNGIGFNAPGLGINTFKGGFDLSRTPANQNALDNLAGSFTNLSGELGALKPLVSPAFGNLTKVGARAIEDTRRRTVGDLRQNLSRRKVLGSSFAADDIARTNAEFSKRDAEFRATTKLQEIEATERLVTQQYEAAASGAEAILTQGNFESTIAAELSRQYTGALAQLAQFESQLLRDEADTVTAGIGVAAGALLGGALDGVGGAIGSALTGGAAAIGGALSSGASAIGGLFSGGAASAAGGAVGGALAGAVPSFGASVGAGAGAGASQAIGGSLGFGAGATGNLLSTAPGNGLAAFGGPQGASVFGAPGGFNGAFEGSAALTAPGEVGTIGIQGADGAVQPGGIFSGASGAALAGGGLAALSALLRGQGVGQAVAQGGGAAAGAAAGFAVGGPAGAIVGGMIGSMGGGALGKKLGISARGGGEDKADYELGTGPAGRNFANGMSSEGPFGAVGFGRVKHLNNSAGFQAGFDAITETDKIISSQLTPQENADIKARLGKNTSVGKNSNEGGFSPARMMNQYFKNRSSVLREVLGKERFTSLGLDTIYSALQSGDQNQITAAFGG